MPDIIADSPWLLFNCFNRLSPRLQEKLRESFGSLALAAAASQDEWRRTGVRPEISAAFQKFRDSFRAAPLYDLLKKENIGLVTVLDQEYPDLLREIYGYPPLLYYRGSLASEGSFKLAVVGTRDPSAYGKSAVSALVSSLAGSKVIIVSGLALGIDAASHECALENGLKTWAFIGSGLNRRSLYPSENIKLADRIVEAGGAIFSEFPIFSRPDRFNFPKRNRLIAGASQATLVIEAALKSGALITARYALEQNRDVLAIPGDIGREQSVGPNRLLQQGARLISCPDDLREACGLDQSGAVKSDNIENDLSPIVPEYAPAADKIWKVLDNRCLSADEIARECGLDTRNINSTLSVMEITGKLGAENGYYRRLTFGL